MARQTPRRLKMGQHFLSLLPTMAATTVYDLGCGTGHLTRELAKRYSTAKCRGIDKDTAAIRVAKQLRIRGASFQVADLCNWCLPRDSADILFSHLAMHWLDDHGLVLKRLANGLRPGGVVAIAMSVVAKTRIRRALIDTCSEPHFRERLGGAELLPMSVQPVSWYSQFLANAGFEELICDTYSYHIHLLPSELITWTSTSVLPAYLQRLRRQDKRPFIESLEASLQRHYRVDRSGRIEFTLPVRRVVARKPND